MKDFNAHIESSNRRSFTDPICLQQLFNEILREIADARISTEKDLLLNIKRKWMYLDYNDFSTVGDFIASITAVMDEALKVFRYLRFTDKTIGKQIDGVYIAYDNQENFSSIEAWMFLSGTKQKKQNILLQSVDWLETTFSEKGWVLRGVDLKTGKHIMRVKSRRGYSL
ncbi:hypothetical protein [Alteribacillus bidgolensis]|uniref:Uncharacterized protein n=1 Tax=Alteribacillus bidgolensis TaxID=930129 RepID=A0A1G8NMJ6_9BACI|nr:hypothetical protein [Alteribacillus bidgolensis]SDI81357.1 hypothetical protein SAMN05216352_11281 [Alteribacillus bidgolensis]